MGLLVWDSLGKQGQKRTAETKRHMELLKRTDSRHLRSIIHLWIWRCELVCEFVWDVLLWTVQGLSSEGP